MKKTFNLDNGFNVAMAFPDDSITKISDVLGMDVRPAFDEGLNAQINVIRENNKDMGTTTSDDLDNFDPTKIYVLVTKEVVEEIGEVNQFRFFKKSIDMVEGVDFYSDVLDGSDAELLGIKGGEGYGCITKTTFKAENIIRLSDLVGKQNLPGTKEVLIDNGPYYFQQHVQRFGDPWPDYEDEDIRFNFLDAAAKYFISEVSPIHQKIKTYLATKKES